MRTKNTKTENIIPVSTCGVNQMAPCSHSTPVRQSRSLSYRFPLTIAILVVFVYVVDASYPALDDSNFQMAVNRIVKKGSYPKFGPIDSWNTSHVTDMSFAFTDAHSFNGDISAWDVSNVTSMEQMFFNAESFNGYLNNWNVSKVDTMVFMFGGATSFHTKLHQWNTSNVSNMSGMFYNAQTFNRNIVAWDVSKVTDMYSMFENANSFNINLSGWNVANTFRFDYMFLYATSFNQVLCWDTGSTSSTLQMFDGTKSSLVPFYECSLLPQSPLRIVFDGFPTDTKYCIYASNNYVSENTRIAIQKCQTWSSFKWTIDNEGKIHNYLDSNLCIQTKKQNIFLRKCMDGARNQQWMYSKIGKNLVSIQNGMKGFVLKSSVAPDKVIVQNRLHTGMDTAIWKLEYDDQNNLPEINFDSYQIVSRLSLSDDPITWCLVPKNILEHGAKIVIRPCKLWKNYKWMMDPSGQIKNLAKPTLCLGSISNRIELQTCVNGKVNQRWVYSKLGKFLSLMRSGINQLTVTDHEAVDNAMVKLHPSEHSGLSYQTWELKGFNHVF